MTWGKCAPPIVDIARVLRKASLVGSIGLPGLIDRTIPVGVSERELEKDPQVHTENPGELGAS